MITLENIRILFTPAYLFNANPSYDIKFLTPLIVFFGGLVFLSLVFWFIAKKNKKRKHKNLLLAYFYNWFFWVGLIGLLLLSFRYEGIAFISMRFLLIAWLFTFIVWGIYLIVFYFKGYKKILSKYKEQIEREKYFRKKKK